VIEFLCPFKLQLSVTEGTVAD